MVLNSWLSVFNSKLFGEKLPKRSRNQQSKFAAQATQNLEVLESRQLLTVIANDDFYGPVSSTDPTVISGSTSVIGGVTVDSSGVLANDDLTQISGSFTFDNTDITTTGATTSTISVNADGSFTFTPDASLKSLNSGETATETFTYFFNDGDGSAGATINVTVAGVNDQVTGTNLIVTGSYTEDGGAQTAGTTFITVDDPDLNDTITATLTFDAAAGTLAATNGGFTSSNGVLIISGTQTVVNDALASLVFTPGADYNGTVEISVEIADGFEDMTIPVYGSITLTGTAVNDQPTATNSTQSANYTEDAGAQSLGSTIVVTDVDLNEIITATLTLSDTSAGALAGTGANFTPGTGVLSITGTVAEVNTALASLTFTPTANYNGNFTIGVDITDGLEDGTTPITGTITVTGTPVNDAPIGDPANFSIAENSVNTTSVGTVTASDVDMGDTLTFSITSGNTGGAFTIDPTSGVITVANSLAVNFETNPVFNLVVTVTDGDGATGTAAVTVTLTDVDEPLELTLPSEPITFYARHGQTPIDAAAAFVDPDGVYDPHLDLNGATLTVQITENSNRNDRLSVYGQPAGPGNISLDGKNINFGEIRIGRITKSSTGGGALIITFNENATPEAVSALLKVIAYKSTVATFPTAPKTITFTIADANLTVLGSDTQIVNLSTTAPSREVQLSGTPIHYSNSSAAIGVAPTAIVTGPSYLDFNGGRFDVQIKTTNPHNQLGIAEIGGITRDGNDFFYNGVLIGSGVVGKNQIQIKLSTSAASPEAVQALARAVTFATDATNTNVADRIINFKLTDVTGVKLPTTTQTVVFYAD